MRAVDGVRCFSLPANVRNSQQYFVIRVARDREPGMRDRLYASLRDYNVIARRYFYPLCSDANCYRALPSAGADRLPNARKVANEVLALPFYGDLGEAGVHRVSDIITYVMEH